jgi:hypothetical protein
MWSNRSKRTGPRNSATPGKWRLRLKFVCLSAKGNLEADESSAFIFWQSRAVVSQQTLFDHLVGGGEQRRLAFAQDHA